MDEMFIIDQLVEETFEETHCLDSYNMLVILVIDPDSLAKLMLVDKSNPYYLFFLHDDDETLEEQATNEKDCQHK